MSGFHDSEPTRNQSELRFQIWDWFKVNTDDVVSRPVLTYGYDET
jgi:hypothetical protein